MGQILTNICAILIVIVCNGIILNQISTNQCKKISDKSLI